MWYAIVMIDIYRHIGFCIVVPKLQITIKKNDAKFIH